MKSFARLYALPKRKTETAAHIPAGGQKVATPPRKATPPPPPQESEPPSPPDTHTTKRDAVEAAWQRMQGDDTKATALAAKKLRSYARVRAPTSAASISFCHAWCCDRRPETS